MSQLQRTKSDSFPAVAHKQNVNMKIHYSILIPIVIIGIVLLPKTQAVVPPPDGCYPNFTTAEGCNALDSLTTGSGNTAVGWRSLFFNTDGGFNTAVGAGALTLNNGSSNTAVGTAALLLNTTGLSNTAVGTGTLLFNDSGFFNTATGYFALMNNTTGGSNTANGASALFSNTEGASNTAAGDSVLFSNTTGQSNTANGSQALFYNTTGAANTAVGYAALFQNTIGNHNIALGSGAGYNLTTGSNNIDIGDGGGLGGESATIRIGAVGIQTRTFIAAIRGVTTGNGDAIPVVIDSAGQLGTTSSSRRFKKEIEPMEKASEAILALKPVTFRYKTDTKRTPQFGLIAEEVAAVDPNLVVRDENGQIYTVRYEAVNAMLLNEFVKEYRKVEQQDRRIQKQEATIADLRSAMVEQRKDFENTTAHQHEQVHAITATLKAQAALIQKVSAQIEASKPEKRVVLNSQ